MLVYPLVIMQLFVHTMMGYDKNTHVSNISQYAVILEKSVPIAQYIYAVRADFLPEN